MKKIVSACVLLLFATITHNIESAQRQTRKPTKPQGIIKPKHEKTDRKKQRPRTNIINSLNIAHYYLGDAYNRAQKDIPDKDRQEEHARLLTFLNNATQQVGNAVVDLET